MIGRGFRKEDPTPEVESQGFDSFDLRLGDTMRGERATLGKSLLDVQRELKIKAAYIAAIENCDPTAFDTPGFIAGYVRSYGRYLGLDPDWAFETFCQESGFRPAHGMSAEASIAPKRARKDDAIPVTGMGHDIFSGSATPFIPMGTSMMSGIEPRAVGSVLVLAALIGGLGWGAWSVLQEVQRVTFAPVDQAPEVVAELDPLAGGARVGDEGGAALPRIAEVASQPSAEALDRLYRPRALEAPVLVARDGPISTLSPSTVGTLVPQVDNRPSAPGDFATAAADPRGEVLPNQMGPELPAAVAAALDGAEAPVSGVSSSSSLTLVATGDTWVRVRGGDGAILMERTLARGDTWEVPADAGTPTLRTGQSGAVYFAMGGQVYGPAGPNGSVTSNLSLAPESLAAAFQPADLPDTMTEELRVAGVIGTPQPPVAETDDAVARALAEATAETRAMPSVTGVQVTEPVAQMTMVAVRPAWVRIRSSEGTVLFEKIMNAGETWSVPATENPATLRVGESGAIYFAVNGRHYGPAGPQGTVTSDLRLSDAHVLERFEVADPTADSDLASYVRYAEAQTPTE